MGLLHEVFRGLQVDELIEIRLINKKVKPHAVRQHFVTSVEEAEEIALKAESPFEAYYGVSPRKERSGAKSAVSRVTTLWADVDSDDKPKKLAYIRATEGTVLPPSAVVDSGGGYHVYWFLDKSVTIEIAEGLMKLIQADLGTDAVHSADHILRVPGTLNYKFDKPPEVNLQTLRPELRYSARDLRATLIIPRSLKDLILSGDTSEFSGDRSRRDWHVVGGLLAAGVSKTTITEVIFAERRCGGKAQESSGTYLQRTIDKAEQQIAEAEKPPVKPVGNGLPEVRKPPPFREKHGALWLPSRSGGYVQVSTFLLKCTRVLINPDTGIDTLVCDVTTETNTWKDIPIPKTAFGGIRDLLKSLPLAGWQWIGSDRQVRLLLPYLVSKWKDSGGALATATHVLGRHGGKWVAPEQVLAQDGVVDPNESDIVWLPTGREVPKLRYTFPDEGDYRELLRQIVDILPRVNRPGAIWPVLWWYLATPFKTKLADIGVRFPTLNLFGTRGSGKTATILRIMQPLLGIYDARSYDCSTTSFVLLSLLSSTNAIPIAFSDFRRQALTRERYAVLQRYILLAYDVGYDARGRPDQTTVAYPLSAPFSLDGEDPLFDPACKERAIIVNLHPDTVLEGSPAYNAFQELTNVPLGDFAGRYIQYTLGFPVREHYGRSLKLCTEIIEETIPDRNRRNTAVLLLGHSALQHFLGKWGVELKLDNEMLRHILVDPLLESIDIETGRTSLYVDEFVEDCINAIAMAGSTTYPPRFIYKYDSVLHEVYLHLTTAYNWWAQERQRSGQPVLVKRAIKQQLKERDIRRGGEGGQYVVGSRTERIKGSSVWVTIISLAAAAEAGLDVPESLQPEFAVHFKEKKADE